MVNNSGQLMGLMMETSSAYLLADWMATKKVPLMENNWAMSSVCLSAELTAKLKVTMLDCPMVMSLVCPLAESMAMQKDLQMAHMRP
eukprot:scaffold5633_cov74-Skeletonema_marinoi.AAC.2